MAALERFGAYNETVAVLHPAALGLRVSESDLVDIATELQYNRSITSLNLSGNSISEEAATALARTLGEKNANNIQHLKLSNCQLNAACIAPLAQALARNTQIEVLDISTNPVRDDGAAHLARMLEENSTLRTVDFSECKIGPVGTAGLAGALTVNRRLRTLVLRGNKLREAGAIALCKGMKENATLVVLDISGNSINREGGVALSEMLRTNKALESINFGKNFLSDSIPFIASAMCHRGKAARLLDLSCNRISSEACKMMSQILEGHKFSIACLSVESNAIRDDGLVALFHALKGTGLQFLDLCEAGLSGASGVVIADLISACPLLNSIQLDGNALGDDALVEIANSFGKSSSLVSLNLERTKLGSAGCRALAAAIVNNRKTRQLIIAENHDVTAGDIVAILDALATIRTLERLDLSDLGLEDNETVLRALCGVILANPKLEEIVLEHNGISRGMPHSCLTRALAAELVEEVSHAAAGSVSMSSATTRGAGGSLVVNNTNNNNASRFSAAGNNTSIAAAGSLYTSAVHASQLAESSQMIKAKLVNASFRPAWATTIPMEHKELLHGTEDDDAEDGARPPLEPMPNSLHHQLYPGYGNGRFSNGSTIQNITDPVPYTVAVSLGTKPPFIPTCDGAALLKNAPRRPLKYSPYSLVALETNPEQLPVTEDQLRRKFEELDIDRNDFLDREEFKRIYINFQNFGIAMTEQEVDALFKRHCVMHPARVSFDEFCILMLKLAQR